MGAHLENSRTPEPHEYANVAPVFGRPNPWLDAQAATRKDGCGSRTPGQRLGLHFAIPAGVAQNEVHRRKVITQLHSVCLPFATPNGDLCVSGLGCWLVVAVVTLRHRGICTTRNTAKTPMAPETKHRAIQAAANDTASPGRSSLIRRAAHPPVGILVTTTSAHPAERAALATASSRTGIALERRIHVDHRHDPPGDQRPDGRVEHGRVQAHLDHCSPRRNARKSLDNLGGGAV
jgi:hypothetical protein